MLELYHLYFVGRGKEFWCLFFNQIHPLTFTLFFFFSLFCKEGRRGQAGELADSSEYHEKRGVSPLVFSPPPCSQGETETCSPSGSPVFFITDI